jgi:hypothetical protein
MCSQSAIDDPARGAEISANELVIASHAHPTDRVLIAGTAEIGLLTSLIRLGFTNVACQSAVSGPHAPMPKPNILIAPHVATEGELLAILVLLVRDLRPSGALVVRAVGPLALDERRLRRLFMNAGFTAVERRTVRDDATPLWCARKHGAALARAA